MENAMNRTAAALFVSAGVCAGLLAASPSWAQAMGGPYASYNYPYGTYSAYPTSGYPYTNAYGYPYNNAYGYSSDYNNPFWIVTAPLAAVTAPLTALAAPVAQAATAPFAVTASAMGPLMTGRSVATGQMGRMCLTPAKSCELYQASWVGNGCSCRVPGGLARGSVTP
jgi:hypothetical protein